MIWQKTLYKTFQNSHGLHYLQRLKDTLNKTFHNSHGLHYLKSSKHTLYKTFQNPRGLHFKQINSHLVLDSPKKQHFTMHMHYIFIKLMFQIYQVTTILLFSGCKALWWWKPKYFEFKKPLIIFIGYKIPWNAILKSLNITIKFVIKTGVHCTSIKYSILRCPSN